MTTDYPLAWPEGFPRTKSKEAGRFKTTLTAALGNVTTSLRLFGSDSSKPITDLVISSNVTLGVSNPPEPGVAVYFTWEGVQVCIPVDRYSSVAANLQAIHHIIEARRVELRHGTLALVRASFSGFKMLPPPADNWAAVLGLTPGSIPTEEQIKLAYQRKAKVAHPDAGGSAEAMATLNRARDAARKEFGYART